MGLSPTGKRAHSRQGNCSAVDTGRWAGGGVGSDLSTIVHSGLRGTSGGGLPAARAYRVDSGGRRSSECLRKGGGEGSRVEAASNAEAKTGWLLVTHGALRDKIGNAGGPSSVAQSSERKYVRAGGGVNPVVPKKAALMIHAAGLVYPCGRSIPPPPSPPDVDPF